MNYLMIYSLLNLAIFIAAVYYSYKIVTNLSQDAEAASAMFFLKKDSIDTFKYTAALVTFVLAGEVLVFAGHFHGDILMAVGYTLRIITSVAVLYFVRGVSKVTETPSEEE